MTPPKKRIMIVEDQRLIAADIENTLRKIGYDIAGSFASGEEVVAMAFDLHPDLILMDIRLRGELDGIQAAEAIRARADVPIVYLTAYADEETIARAKATTPFGYVVKPFNERELRAAIEVAIYKHATDLLLAEERARRRAAEELKLLVEVVQDYAIFMLDAWGRVATWNQGAQRINGYAAEEIIGQHCSVFYPAEERAAGAPDDVLALALRSGRAELEGWRVRKDGSRFWASVVITPILDAAGKLHGFGEVTRDVTERRRQQEANRFLDRATLALSETIDLPIILQQTVRIIVPDVADWCLIDLAGDDDTLVQVAVAHVDPEKEELARQLGRTHDARTDHEHGPYHVFATGRPEIHPELEDVSWAAQLLGVEHPEILQQLGLYSYMCVPIQLRDRTLGVLSQLRAAPPRRYGPMELAFSMELARRIALAIDNARLYDQARVAIRARDEFLQVASHELKTPLTTLQLQLELLPRTLEKAGIKDERLTEKLATATIQTKRLGRLIDSLLDVSRITAGKVMLELEPFELTELVREVAARYRTEARVVGSELAVRADGPIDGRWDRLRVEQIVSNLLSNAIKYGAGKPVELRVEPGDERVHISVTDRGIGIARDDLARIFGRFERAVSLRHYGGLGLGLFIARQFVEAHGGTLIAESVPGAGSTFTAVLPREPRPAPAPPPEEHRR
jgi:PAS domain S-box-containing protein